MKKISIIIPAFNEEDIVEDMVLRLKEVTDKLQYIIEVIVVDDGSKDATLSKLLKIQGTYPQLKIIQLSRNWGHQNAYNAGLDYATGNAVVFMDGDLEDPPETIKEFIKKWEDGFEVVYATKESRQESQVKKIMSSMFYKLMSRFADVSMDKQAGMFSLVDEKVARELKKCKEKNKYYVGLRFFLGFKQAKISYHRDKRYVGRPKQTYKKLVNYALNAFFPFSFLPIRVVTFFGLFILLVSIFLSLILVAGRIFNFNYGFFHYLPGWTSMVLLILFVLAVQIISMGILGEYIARIFDEVRTRPYYIVSNMFEAEGKTMQKDVTKDELT